MYTMNDHLFFRQPPPTARLRNIVRDLSKPSIDNPSYPFQSRSRFLFSMHPSLAICIITVGFCCLGSHGDPSLHDDVAIDPSPETFPHLAPFLLSDDTHAARSDRVHELPGATELPFSLYAGSVTVDSIAERSLFYVLSESFSNSSSSDPLVLWLNGGPGCSSIGGGFLSELGPFYPTPGGKGLIRNPHTWNKAANLLFLESPAFVGWSWSENPEDTRVGDRRTAEDAFIFLQKWLERYPRYRGRRFWLAGESYGGHYVPNLAQRLVEAVERGEDIGVDFQGFLVGKRSARYL